MSAPTATLYTYTSVAKATMMDILPVKMCDQKCAEAAAADRAAAASRQESQESKRATERGNKEVNGGEVATLYVLLTF